MGDSGHRLRGSMVPHRAYLWLSVLQLEKHIHSIKKYSVSRVETRRLTA
jgi:hypothetical protein